MKHLKLFEGFNKKNFNDIDEIVLNLNMYGLDLKDIYIGTSIKCNNKTKSDNINNFGNSTYKSNTIRFKINGSYELDNLFFTDLDHTIMHIESRFNLKLVNIFVFKPSYGGEYFDSVENFKKDFIEGFTLFDLMFEIL